MNRSLVSFLVFLTLLAAAAGFFVWWLGPNVVRLALDDARRDDPYYLLHLASFEHPGDAGPQYVPRLSELVRSEEGSLVWRGGLVRLLEGKIRDEWQDLLVYRFAAGGDLVQMVTSAEYRNLDLNGQRRLVGTHVPPLSITEHATLLVWLLQNRDDEVGSLGGAAGSVAAGTTGAAVLAELGELGGQVVWDAPLDSLDDTAEWDWLVVLSFPRSEAAEAWFRLPSNSTSRALASKALSRQAWLLMTSGYQ